VFLELGHLRLGGRAVLTGRAQGAAVVEELLVVADQDLLEDGDVAAGRLDVQVAQQGSADVDGQPVVDQVGGEPSRTSHGRAGP
jgi:hypothetical protein